MNQNKELKLGNLPLSSNLALAPLADLSHAAFRQLVGEIGGCGLFYTEMLNARIIAGKSIVNDPHVTKAEGDRPIIAQLVGNDPQRIVAAIQKLEAYGYDGFDINMGCAIRKIVKYGWGAGLMADQEQAFKVVKAARTATDLPLTVKVRSFAGHNTDKLLSFARRLADCGLDGIILHPRSPADGFKRPARRDEITILTQAINIPVIGNGDIINPADARCMLEETGCAGVMIGRGALIRPWIFKEFIDGQVWRGSPAKLFDRLKDLIRQYSPENLAAKRFYANSSWLLRNFHFHHSILAKLRKAMDIEEMHAVIIDEIGRHDRPLVKEPFAGKM